MWNQGVNLVQMSELVGLWLLFGTLWRWLSNTKNLWVRKPIAAGRKDKNVMDVISFGNNQRHSECILQLIINNNKMQFREKMRTLVIQMELLLFAQISWNF